jgi:aminoglycoside phosphotransferase family enzyme/predicted kinase
MKETHISWVFLTGKHAYKVKKPVNYGFLDFSTLEKRRHFCEQELRLNKRLCKDIYLAVLPITESNGIIKIGGRGKVIDYALKMKQLPQDSLMSKLLEEGKINKDHISKISKIVADFHRRSDKVANMHGSVKIRKINWDENFAQSREFVGKSISKKQFDFIKDKIDNFIKYNKNLFEKRIKDGKIRDCHGDLHSGNIFIADKIYIFDAIEFNERFRYVDVASEIAFMAMDLDFHGREDLSQHFVSEYVKYSSDEELLKLLNFYKCYLAYVRGKVISFLKTPEAYIIAKKYFDLAERYAKLLVSEPSLIVMCGLSGSGKSWLAREISQYGDFTVIRSDVIRKQLAKTKNAKSAYGKGIYTKEFTEKTYVEMLKQARIFLRKWKSVILDATFSSKNNRQLAEKLANVFSAPFAIAYCTAPENIMLKRLRGRRGDISDADVAIYRQQKKHFQTPAGKNVVKIDTSNVVLVERGIEKVFNSL